MTQLPTKSVNYLLAHYWTSYSKLHFHSFPSLDLEVRIWTLAWLLLFRKDNWWNYSTTGLTSISRQQRLLELYFLLDPELYFLLDLGLYTQTMSDLSSATLFFSSIGAEASSKEGEAALTQVSSKRASTLKQKKRRRRILIFISIISRIASPYLSSVSVHKVEFEQKQEVLMFVNKNKSRGSDKVGCCWQRNTFILALTGFILTVAWPLFLYNTRLIVVISENSTLPWYRVN